MTQHDLETAVAQATGDDLREIRRHGFSIADPLHVDFDPEPDNLPPGVMDWDEYELQTRVALFAGPHSDRRRSA